ncbi:MAG: PqqD family protein [Clostridia bacterium]|nr:PqqD family protein [Clostridia bacterium]
MRINPDFTIQKVGASYLAVPVGETSKQFHGMIRLNETGAFLWNQMTEKDCTEADLVEALLQEYEVEPAVAKTDVHRVVELLKEHHCLV